MPHEIRRSTVQELDPCGLHGMTYRPTKRYFNRLFRNSTFMMIYVSRDSERLAKITRLPDKDKWNGLIGACASRLPHRRIVIDSPMPPSSSEGRHCRPGGFRDRRRSKHGDRGCRRHRQRLRQGGGADRGELGANRRKGWPHPGLDPRRARNRRALVARARDGEPPRGPLHGIPIAVKDVIDTHDMPTEYGSPIYRGHRPHRDASCVALVRAAGGIVLGKTVTHEFAAIQSPIPPGTRTTRTIHRPAAPPARRRRSPTSWCHWPLAPKPGAP